MARRRSMVPRWWQHAGTESRTLLLEQACSRKRLPVDIPDDLLAIRS
jgi:hypothetical protein